MISSSNLRHLEALLHSIAVVVSQTRQANPSDIWKKHNLPKVKTEHPSLKITFPQPVLKPKTQTSLPPWRPFRACPPQNRPLSGPVTVVFAPPLSAERRHRHGVGLLHVDELVLGHHLSGPVRARRRVAKPRWWLCLCHPPRWANGS